MNLIIFIIVLCVHSSFCSECKRAEAESKEPRMELNDMMKDFSNICARSNIPPEDCEELSQQFSALPNLSGEELNKISRENKQTVSANEL